MDIKIDYSEKRKDHRGFLVDFLKSSEVDNKKLGQIYFVTFSDKGKVRGEHFHKNKREWFSVVEGRVMANFIDLETGEEKEMLINGDQNRYRRIEIGPNIWHRFESVSKKAAMINYSNKGYDEKKPDTWEMEEYEG